MKNKRVKFSISLESFEINQKINTASFKENETYLMDSAKEICKANRERKLKMFLDESQTTKALRQDKDRERKWIKRLNNHLFLKLHIMQELVQLNA